MPRRARVIPGFSLSLGFTVFYLSLVVLLPLSALVVRSATLGWPQFWRTVGSPYTLSAVRFTLAAAACAAALNVGLGLLIAWVLGRYAFPGRRLLDALIDLPFALPTAVAGIALYALYSDKGPIGSFLARIGFRYPWPTWRGFGQGPWPVDVRWYSEVALAPLGVVIALAFVGLPFVVRTVQPVIEDMGRDVEEAAASLGARPWHVFTRVTFPEIRPALLTGFTLAFARGVGEYGSVIFISGNLPATRIAPQVIIGMIDVNETGNYADATAVALLLLVIAFAVLLPINLLQRATARRAGP